MKVETLVFVFFYGLHHLALCPQGSHKLSYMSECPFCLKLNNIPSARGTTFCFSVHAHLGSFHLWAVVNMGVEIPFQNPAFNSFGIYAAAGLLNPRVMVILYFIFRGFTILLTTVAAPFKKTQHFDSLISMASLCFRRRLWFSGSVVSGWKVIFGVKI